MYIIQVISYMVVILCTSNYITGQSYDDETYDDYSSDGEAKSDSAETSGFVTPLDFSPLFGGAAFGGLSGVASAPVKKYQSLFNVGGAELAVGQDFFQAQSSDKQFSPESFGFLPQFSQGLVAESISTPKRYQEKTVQIERTKATATSSDITRTPLQFNIETKHVPYKKINKPELSAALKLADYKTSVTNAPNNKNDDSLLLSDEHLAPYKKYSFQPDSLNPTPTYASLSTGYPGANGFSQFDDRNLRYKRYSNKRKPKGRKARQDEESDGDDSGYNYRSDYSSRPKEFDDSKTYDAPDFSGYDGEKKDKQNYEYGEDEEYGSDEYERIKSLSQKQAAELKKHPENCKQVQKNSMTCTVCTNPKNGGSYESCAYASEPKNNKYAYVKQQKFDSNDEPENEEESKEVTKTENPVKSQKIKSSPKKISVKPTKQAYETVSSYKYSSPKVYTTSKPIKSSNSQRYTKSTEKPSSDYRDYYTAPLVIKGESSKPEKYSAYPQDDDEEEEEEEGDEQTENNDEGNEEESEEDSPIPGFFTNNEEKKDVESVLAEFTKKDRTACKKVLKNHMTCYQCIDKNGMKHEECMFVSESAPKTSHLAYKEVKEFNSKPQAAQNSNGNEEAESQIVTVKPLAELILSTTVPSLDLFTKIKKNQPLKKYNGLEDFKKITPTTFIGSPLDKITTQFQISSTASTKLDLSPTKLIIKREARKSKKVNKQSNEYEKFDAPPSDLSNLDRIADPDDFAGAESKGAFWAETVPEFNEKLGVALPRYMLEKTDDEAEFDRALAANGK